jgi:hypothetical protein
MTRKEIEVLWRDPRNRKWGVFYHCKEDPRVIVPKHVRWTGWTVNTARLGAIPVTLALIALVGVPTLLVTASGASTWIQLLTVGMSTTTVCSICAYLSSRTE